MRRFDAPLTVAAGAVLVLAVNVVMLGTAWSNRTGEPESRFDVTERELAMPLWRDKEDTGLVLTLSLADRPPAAVARTAWFRNDKLPPFEHAWLDTAKLAELRFDLRALEARARDAIAHGEPAGVTTRRAFVVLEYEGEAWRAWLAAREAEVAKIRDQVERGLEDRGKLSEAEVLLAIDRTSRSRLMAVDAGLDPDPLRGKHPNRNRCAVVPAWVGARVTVEADGRASFRGTIERVAVEGITVPRKVLPRLAPFVPEATAEEVNKRARDDASASRWPAPTAPRYRATLAYGRRLDPWLADIAPIGDAAK